MVAIDQATVCHVDDDSARSRAFRWIKDGIAGICGCEPLQMPRPSAARIKGRNAHWLIQDADDAHRFIRRAFANCPGTVKEPGIGPE